MNRYLLFFSLLLLFSCLLYANNTPNGNINKTYNEVNNVALDTYVLNLTIIGGAPDHMITISPKGTLVDNKLTFKKGTTVTLTAGENQIFTFNNWRSGETSISITIKMTSDQNVIATYSAKDYIVGWDFYKSSNKDRHADFCSGRENQSSTLVLRNSAGGSYSWRDYSLVKGGYAGRGTAAIFNTLDSNYYFQVSFNASGYSDIKVSSAMQFTFNTYSVQILEYSVDGVNFDSLGCIKMTALTHWIEETVTLPSDANNAQIVYFRWKPDYTSKVVGYATKYDGAAISGIYITGKKDFTNDGKAPILCSSVPTNDAEGACLNGRIVLNFDKKVQIAKGATVILNDNELDPIVTGNSIIFPYYALDYVTEYTFTLPGDKVSDLDGNKLTSDITIKFETRGQKEITKKVFDYVVGVDGDIADAISAAGVAASSGERFYIFFPNGEYNIGKLMGDANQMTTISVPNVSYIGQNPDSVIVFNKAINEAINTTATIYFTSASSNIYMQDISLMNKAKYRNGSDLYTTQRYVALRDQGDKNIYKNIKLLSTQDTYYTGYGKTYHENSEIHGTVDFICGGGDVFFNKCLIYLEDRSENIVCAPATASDWGYVFSNCTIDGFSVNNDSYLLGRSWSMEPKAVFINTNMNVVPATLGWGDPMNVVPTVFAEYNSKNPDGSSVNLSGRRTTYTKFDETVVLDPVLTEEEASEHSLINVLGGNDGWQPQKYTQQAPAPVILVNSDSTNISWDNNENVLCWGIFLNNKFVEFTVENSYNIPDSVEKGIYTIRAANEMGGLGKKSNAFFFNVPVGIKDISHSMDIIEQKFYTVEGKRLESLENYRGMVIIQNIFSNGYINTVKVYNDLRLNIARLE